MGAICRNSRVLKKEHVEWNSSLNMFGTEKYIRTYSVLSKQFSGDMRLLEIILGLQDARILFLGLRRRWAASLLARGRSGLLPAKRSTRRRPAWSSLGSPHEHLLFAWVFAQNQQPCAWISESVWVSDRRANARRT